MPTAIDYGTYAAPVSMPFDYSAAMYHNYASNGRYYDQSAYDHSAVAIPVSQYPHDTSYQHQYQAEDYRNNGYSTYTNVPTRRRKIIMKQLPPWATYNQIQHLVRQKAGSDADKLQKIDLPLSNGQESNQGYALITFENEDATNKVIQKLNGYKDGDRTLRVEYTKEGVSANESSRSKGSGHHAFSSHHRERREDRDRRDNKKSTKVSSSSNKKSQSHKSHKSHKSDVIIADGSSFSLKKYEEKKSTRK